MVSNLKICGDWNLLLRASSVFFFSMERGTPYNFKGLIPSSATASCFFFGEIRIFAPQFLAL